MLCGINHAQNNGDRVRDGPIQRGLDWPFGGILSSSGWGTDCSHFADITRGDMVVEGQTGE